MGGTRRLGSKASIGIFVRMGGTTELLEDSWCAGCSLWPGNWESSVRNKIMAVGLISSLHRPWSLFGTTLATGSVYRLALALARLPRGSITPCNDVKDG